MRRKPRVWFERAVVPELITDVAARCEILGPGNTNTIDPFAAVPDAEGVVAGAMVYGADFMDRAPRLRVIARTGIGVDKVDLMAATSRGVSICNTPDGPTISTAEHAMMLMLVVAKQVKQSEQRLREGEPNLYARHDALELDGKALGLVGFGRIAQRVAGVAAALGMQVTAYDPYSDISGEVSKVESLAELLQIADFISVHVPLTEETHNMFGSDVFAAMRPGAIFVNTARGALVDQEALLAALDSGHLFGAGLDVTDPEPLAPDHPLLQRDDVVVTPHVASGTRAGRRRLFTMAFEQVLDVLSGVRPANLVNPEVWE